MSEITSDFVPRLDTIEFDQLVELGRGQIPRYAPDWTDHNVHDPGMTLVDLLAWIVDQQIYRTGSVGGRHRRAFAALLGQRPGGARAASGLIWPSRVLEESRLVPEGAEVVCDAHPRLPFVLGRQLHLTSAAPVHAHLTVDGAPVPVPASDLEGTTWSFDEVQHLHTTALTLGFAGPLGRRTDPAPISLGFDVGPPPGAPPSPSDRPWGPVSYEYRAGNQAPWTELRIVHDGTAGMAVTGVVILEVPPADPGAGESELRISFDRGFFPVLPRVLATAVNVLPVVQLERIPPAPFPQAGTGLPDQALELETADLVAPLDRAHGPVLEVEVDGERWQQRPELSRSGPDDPHFVVHADQVLFGNGLNGRCPAPGAPIVHTGLARTAGVDGNLRRGLAWTVPALETFGAAYGVNRQALAGGRHASRAEELVADARAAATRRAALLTDDELVTAAYRLPGMAVGRAEVIPRFDRRLPDRPVDGVRTLVVVPHDLTPEPGRTRTARRVEVPQTYLREVAERLGRRRVLGERLIVQGPDIVTVDLWVTVTTEPWALAEEVGAAVSTAVCNRLTVVRRSGAVEPWPLGRDLTVAEVLSLVANVAGVSTVPAVRVATSGAPPGEGPVPVPTDGVVVAGEVHIDTDDGGVTERTDPAGRGWD